VGVELVEVPDEPEVDAEVVEDDDAGVKGAVLALSLNAWAV